jgi:hypothetical protein
MTIHRPRSAGKPSQAGYALLMVVFMATALLLVSIMVAPSILTYGKREKEKEMIWRGKQYARGVKLYYRKLGRFPTSLDDLTKPKVGSLRFMRQAYKDPMNSQDGSWRLIYVGPAGQLIGSLKPPQQNLQFGQAPGIGTPAAALAAPGAPGNPLQPGGMNPPGQTGSQAGAGSGTNPPSITGAPVSADQGTASGAPAIPMGDTPTIIGGNIIGVGSKINKSSIMVYEKAKNYRLFEFIWDPSKDTIGIGQAGMQTGTGLGVLPGQGAPGVPVQPPQNPQQPPQTPQQ